MRSDIDRAQIKQGDRVRDAGTDEFVRYNRGDIQVPVNAVEPDADD